MVAVSSKFLLSKKNKRKLKVNRWQSRQSNRKKSKIKKTRRSKNKIIRHPDEHLNPLNYIFELMEELNELKNLVIQTLEANGSLSNIRAQIRSSVFKVID